MDFSNGQAQPQIKPTPPAQNGPDLLSIEQLHKMLAIDDVFHAEFSILSPHLRKITQNWSKEIPMKVVGDQMAQDSMLVRDLFSINENVEWYLNTMYAGEFYDHFEAPLDGIAITLKAHGINPGWATVAFAAAFDMAQQKLYFETRKLNQRVYPAALRCLNKIMVLTIHILNRRDCELNDITPQRGMERAL